MRSEGAAGRGSGASGPPSRRLLPRLVHASVATLATWPLLAAPGGVLIGHPDADVWNHAWGPWWFARSLAVGEVPLVTELLGAPMGGKLWFADPVGGLLGAALVAPLGTIGAYACVVFVSVLLASIGGRRLARALGADAGGAWLAAACTACSPYLLSELHNGVSEALWVGFGLLALSALARAATAGPEGDGHPPRARLRSWAASGFWSGLAGVAGFSHALGLVLVAAPVAVAALMRAPRRTAFGLAVAGCIAAAIGAPALLAARWTVEDAPHALVWRDQASWQERMPIVAHNAVDPRTLLVPGLQSVDLAAQGEAFLHASYIGWVVLALAIAARRRRWLVAAAVGLVFSLGPFLWWDGGYVRLGGKLLALPFAALLDALPAGATGHPQRLAAPALGVVAALAGVGWSRLSRWAAAGGVAGGGPPARWRRVVPSAVAGLAVVELLAASPWPVATARFPDSDVGARVRADAQARGLDGKAIVLDLPADAPGHGMLPSRYLLLQTVHGQPIPYAPDVRMNTSRLGQTEAVRGLVLAEVPFGGAEALARVGVGWVILHPDVGDVALADTRLRAALGAPEAFGAARLWRVPEPAALPASPVADAHVRWQERIGSRQR